MKPEHSRLIPRKLTENLELLIVSYASSFFLYKLELLYWGHQTIAREVSSSSRPSCGTDELKYNDAVI